MGNRATKTSNVDKEDKKKSDKLDDEIWREKESENQVIKLLLLGAGESGKSTLFKQMIRLYGTGFAEKDFLMYIPMIHINTMDAIKELCLQTELLGAVDSKCAIQDPEVRRSRIAIDDMKIEDKVTPDVAVHVAKLWQDPGIQYTYSKRARFQLVDSAAYFFNNLERISQPNFIPTDEDLIRCRVRTTGIIEGNLTIDDNKFLIIDVGGQRNERKKWIHCFEGVTAVIFVAALSEYDQALFEDATTNRMTEALKLFEETCVLKWFADTSFILFLNKCDLFADKIQKVPLSTHMANYKGDNSYDDGIEFIKQQFEERCYQRGLYVHITCATDQNNVAAVFGAVKDIIIQSHLAESGLI